ncbi:hypothetical protein ACFPYJ_19250 [Paenibacillus solisilvae]|uniref:Myb-like domain-containing protein n=1 Tax=Paenibacillus solisilvae TaxID=2486751 RepID=A0ABW0W0I5_9BACL
MQEARKDGWRTDEDQLLAKIVIKHICEKSTQLAAFNEAARQLGRTESACGFRWNSQIRKQYATEIEGAKLERNQRSNSNQIINQVSVSAIVTEAVSTDQEYMPDYMDKIIQLAEKQQQLIKNMAIQIKSLKEQLQQKNDELEQLKFIPQQTITEETLKEDFETLLQIFHRAKQLT